MTSEFAPNFDWLGLATPTSNSSRLNALQFLIDRGLNRLSTAALVKVVAVTNTPGQIAAVGQVDVLPLINQLDGHGNAVPHQTVFGLCYFRYQGGSNAVVIDPEVGDIGLAVFADRDISSIKARGPGAGQSNPGSRRRFDMADGVYFGLPIGAAPAQYVAFTPTGITIADRNGNRLVTGPNGIAITAIGAGIAVTSELVSNTGGVTAGAGGADSVTLQGHTHIQANDSHGDSEAPTNAPTAGT